MCSTRQRLAALLREQRSSRGVTMRRAAETAGISPSTLSRWESGACLPRVPELESVLKSLGVSEREITRILSSLDVPRAAKAVRNGERNRAFEIPPPSGGELLRALRSSARLSVTSVAESLGVSPSTVSRWESCQAHPSPENIQQLLDLVAAKQNVRECVAATGVAKLNVERPPYNRILLEEELTALEALIPAMPEDLEFRLLQIQSRLWWFRDEEGGLALLRRAIVTYAEFLCKSNRFREAASQAQTLLDSGVEPYGELGLRAFTCIARSDVYRWQTPRPHLGLYTLQRCVAASSSSRVRAKILHDMAEYSLLAGRSSEALNYKKRALCIENPVDGLSARGA